MTDSARTGRSAARTRRTGYRTNLRTPLPQLLGLAESVLPGRTPLGRQLSRRSAWGLLPHRRAERPDDVNRVAFTVDLDYQADTDALPGLIELVGRTGTPLSVAAVGALVELDPGPYAAALAAGHEIVNHSQTHPDNPVLNPDEEFWHLSDQRLAEEVGQAQEVIASRLGVRPTGFRTPHFKDTHSLTAVLEAVPEFDYNSSVLATRSPLGAQPYPMSSVSIAGRDGHLFCPSAFGGPAGREPLLQIPLTACPAHRWSPFCSWHGIRAGADRSTGAGMHDLDEWGALWRQTLRQAWADGLVVVYFDPHDLMRDAETAATFEAMVTFARESGWQPCTLAEVAAAYRPSGSSGPAGRSGTRSDRDAGRRAGSSRT